MCGKHLGRMQTIHTRQDVCGKSPCILLDFALPAFQQQTRRATLLATHLRPSRFCTRIQSFLGCLCSQIHRRMHCTRRHRCIRRRRLCICCRSIQKHTRIGNSEHVANQRTFRRCRKVQRHHSNPCNQAQSILSRTCSYHRNCCIGHAHCMRRVDSGKRTNDLVRIRCNLGRIRRSLLRSRLQCTYHGCGTNSKMNIPSRRARQTSLARSCNRR